MERRALVTGAGGFIGHHMVKYLISLGLDEYHSVAGKWVVVVVF